MAVNEFSYFKTFKIFSSRFLSFSRFVVVRYIHFNILQLQDGEQQSLNVLPYSRYMEILA